MSNDEILTELKKLTALLTPKVAPMDVGESYSTCPITQKLMDEEKEERASTKES